MTKLEKNRRNGGIKEKVFYESGGMLKVFNNNKKHYEPSWKYKNKVQKLKNANKIPLEERIELHERNKLLHENNFCISVENLIDTIFNNSI